MKVLMVCLGNICRSPLAHGILENKVAKNGLNVIVDSAGTGSWHIGENPDSRSIEVGLNHGINQILHRQGLDVRVDLGERTLKGSYTNDQIWFDEEMEEAVNQCFGDFMELFGYSFKGEKLPSPIISGKGLRLKNFKRIR